MTHHFYCARIVSLLQAVRLHSTPLSLPPVRYRCLLPSLYYRSSFLIAAYLFTYDMHLLCRQRRRSWARRARSSTCPRWYRDAHEMTRECMRGRWTSYYNWLTLALPAAEGGLLVAGYILLVTFVRNHFIFHILPYGALQPVLHLG